MQVIGDPQMIVYYQVTTPGPCYIFQRIVKVVAGEICKVKTKTAICSPSCYCSL